MFRESPAFSSFSVDDIDRARGFYADILGLEVLDVEGMTGLIRVVLGSGAEVLVYAKPDHVPAGFTVLSFPVADVDAAVDGLNARGVTMERYEGFDQDERGISRSEYGPTIAWFSDPAGNVLAVLEDAR